MTADASMVRRGPLATELAVGSPATVAMRNLPWRTLLELRVPTAEDGTGADTAMLESALGLPMPAPGLTRGAGQRLAVWLGPGWWLLDDEPDDASGDLEPALVRHLAALDGPATAVDVSAGFAVLELTGPQAPAVLAHGCSIDLHPRVFGPGQAARTTLAKAQVVLAQLDAAPTYRIWVRSSFARYLVAWLLDAATEYLVR